MHASARLATGLQKFGSKVSGGGGGSAMYTSARAPNFPEELTMFVWKAAIKVDSSQRPVHSELIGAALLRSARGFRSMACMPRILLLDTRNHQEMQSTRICNFRARASTLYY